MRYYFKHPQWELRPADDVNYVPVMYKVRSTAALVCGWLVLTCRLLVRATSVVP